MLDKKGDTTADAAAMADTYLRDNFRALYTQYSDAADYIEQIREKFGEANKSVEQMISDMDEDHLGMLMDLDQSTIKDWDTLAGIIQRIAGIDLSYTASAIALDPKSAQAAASEKYNIYETNRLLANILDLEYNYSEKITIPKELFINETGIITFNIYAEVFNENGVSGASYGASQPIYYKVTGNKVELSTKEFK